MISLPPALFTMATLGHAAVGAIGGAAIAAVIHVIRDRDGIMHRLHVRRRKQQGDISAWAISDEPHGYLENVLSDEEREAFPRTLAGTAIGGAFFWVGAKIDSEVLLMMGIVLAEVVTLLRFLSGDPAGTIDAQTSERVEGPGLGRKFTQVAWSLLALALPLATILGAGGRLTHLIGAAIGWTLGRLWPLVVAGCFGVWAYRQYAGPSDHLTEGQREHWDRENAIMLIAALAFGIVTLFFTLF